MNSTADGMGIVRSDYVSGVGCGSGSAHSRMGSPNTSSMAAISAGLGADSPEHHWETSCRLTLSFSASSLWLSPPGGGSGSNRRERALEARDGLTVLLAMPPCCNHDPMRPSRTFFATQCVG